MGDRLYSLQVLRAIAACSVVLLHATTLRLPSESHRFYFAIGAVGVDLFFVLSGVIIALIAHGSAWGFIARRIWRVVPLFWIMAAVQVALLPNSFSWRNYVTTLTFWPAWQGEYWTPVVGVGWTLCFEMLFYTAAAITVADRRAIWPLFLAFAGCWIGLELTGHSVFRFLGNPIILEFLFGVAIGLMWKRGVRIRTPGAVAASIVGVTLLLLLPIDVEVLTYAQLTMTGDRSLERAVMLGMPSALIVLGFINLKCEWPAWLIAIGDGSYSIYLAHAVALSPFYYSIPPDWLRPYTLPLYLFFAGVASLFVYQWLEKPMLNLARRKRRRDLVPYPASSSAE